MNASRALSLLVVINLALLGALAFVASSPPRAALAQAGTGLSGNYMAVAAEVRDQFDALYLIDMQHRVLHGLLFDKGTKRLQYADSRDLERDLRNNRENP